MSSELATGFEPQARALAPLVDRRRAVQQTLELAPPALDALRDGLRRSDPLLRDTARFARATMLLTRPARAALREVTALLRESPRPLRTTGTLLRLTASAVPPTLRLTRRLDPLIQPSIRALHNGLSTLAELDRRSCDYLGFARNWRGMLAFGIPSNNPIGPQTGLRVGVTGEAQTANQIVADVPAVGPARPTRYPRPCALGPVTPLAGGSRNSRDEAVRESGQAGERDGAAEADVEHCVMGPDVEQFDGRGVDRRVAAV